jgi:hypothetical protein
MIILFLNIFLWVLTNVTMTILIYNSFVYLLFLRICSGLVVWLFIIFLFGLELALASLFLDRSKVSSPATSYTDIHS